MASLTVTQNRFSTRALFEGGMRLFVLLVALALLVVFVDWLLRSDTYRAQTLQFEGTFEHVSEQQLQQAVMAQVGGNYLMLDLEGVKQRIEALPWVHRAWVRRSWPNGIHVRFTEQQLAARWGETASINLGGEVLSVSVDRGSSLPVLHGPEGSAPQVLEHYHQFEPIVRAMGEHIASLTLQSRRSWQLVLTSGLQITVDERNSEARLLRLARVYRRLPGTPRTIDLRYANGFAVDWGKGSQQGPGGA